MKLTELFADDNAVSPVIGVILMVAITVILAAVIGTFVLGLGENIQNTAPTASVSFNDASAGYDGTVNTATDLFVLSHQSGDSLEAENVKIVIRNEAGAAVATWDSGSWSGSWTTANLQQPSSGGNEFGPGDSVTEFAAGDSILITSDDPANEEAASGTTYELQIIHKPSEATVASGTVTLS